MGAIAAVGSYSDTVAKTQEYLTDFQSYVSGGGGNHGPDWQQAASVIGNAIGAVTGVPGLGEAVSLTVDLGEAIVSLFGGGGGDHRIGVSSQALSDAVDLRCGLPGRFAATIAQGEKANWRRYPLPLDPSVRTAAALFRAALLYAQYGGRHMHTRSPFDITERRWLKKWWDAKVHEYNAAAKLTGLRELHGKQAETIFKALSGGGW